MKLKSILATLFLALGIALPASALTVRNFDLGDLSNTSITFPVFTADTGDYLDIFEFSVSGPGGGFGGAGNLVFDDPLFSGVETNFDIAAIALFDSLFATLASDTDGSDGFSLFSVLPSAGVYRLAVLGEANGTINGAYNGFIQTAVERTVPEPETAALALMALVGTWVSTHRRKAATST